MARPRSVALPSSSSTSGGKAVASAVIIFALSVWQFAFCGSRHSLFAGHERLIQHYIAFCQHRFLQSRKRITYSHRLFPGGTRARTVPAWQKARSLLHCLPRPHSVQWYTPQAV